MYADSSILPAVRRREKPKCHSSRSDARHNRVAENGFWCKHCDAFVYALPGVSGVVNRNHCPYCLWSCHLDHFQTGDRLSACRAVMQPIGLTIKPTRNKYGGSHSGELMVIHQCRDCGKLSINRIAADDLVEVVEGIFRASFHLDERIQANLHQAGIHPLLDMDEHIVQCQLYGVFHDG
ncbi:MAG: RNHCP domain-containing protein [Acidobacteriaceae bacterium]